MTIARSSTQVDRHETKCLVVIFVEGLGTSLVGAYGANTAHTPAIDRLAARGVVLDQCYVDSNCLQTQLASLWTGRHAMQPKHAPDVGWTIWSQLAESSTEACVITDCPEVAAQAERLGCTDVFYLEPIIAAYPRGDNAECSLCGVFAAAAEELAAGRSGLVWIHSRGLKLPWDAPVELRGRFADPEDPDPPQEVGPPMFALTEDADPDMITGWGQVAAAQAAVADQAIAALQKIVAAREEDARCSWVIGSLGGVSLGENRYLGFGNPVPHTEQLRSVAILCPAASQTVGRRCAELFQLPDLCVSMLELLAEQPPSNPECWGQSCLRMPLSHSPEHWPKPNQLAVLSTDQWQWVRCPAWSAVLEAGQTVRLFVKPDDRWEVTDVANRRVEVTERIEACFTEFVAAAQQHQRGAWPELGEELTNLLR